MTQHSGLLRTLAFIAVVIVIGAAMYVMLQPDAANSPNTPTGGEQTKTLRYANATYKISFAYPDTYVLTERDAEGSAERRHHVVILMDKVAAENIPQGGEGPTAITVEFFQNDLDQQSIEDWIKNTANSNYKLSPDGALTSTTIGGKSGLSYTWDGLYRGESIVSEHNDNIVVFSVTTLTADDQIRSDFDTVVESVRFE